MASFEIAYSLERKHEGYYVNNPNDKGGETYIGIARNIHPSWIGWPIVDEYKKSLNRPLKNNEVIRDLRIEPFVKDFYHSLWVSNNFGKIKDQNTANILYDWFINSGYIAAKTKDPETFGVDEILNRNFKKSLKLDGRFDTDTIQAINQVDNVKLYNLIKYERINFYKNLVKKNPSQIVFLKGWLSRINSFVDLNPLKITGGLVVITLIILILYYNQ